MIDNLEFRMACKHGNGEIEREKGVETVCHLSEETDARQVVMDEEEGKFHVDTRDVEIFMSDPGMAWGTDEGFHIKSQKGAAITVHNQREADIRGSVRGEPFRD